MKKILILLSLLMISGCSYSSKYDQFVKNQYDLKMDNINISENAPDTLKIAVQNDDIYFLVFETTAFHQGLILGVEISKSNLEISDVLVIEHQETPDYGGVVEEGWFTQRYIKQSIYSDTKIVRWMSTEDSEVVAITEATITSNAVNMIINQAKEFIREIEG